MKHYEYVFVIPTYNERENIASLVLEIKSLYPKMLAVVVDDNSPDETAAVVRNLSERVEDVVLLESDQRRGLAESYQRAFIFILENYLSEWVITMDADFSHDPKDIRSLISCMPKSDVVVGSRFVQEGSATGMALKRRLLSMVGNWYARIVTSVSVADLTSGFVAYRSNFLSKIIKRPILNNHFACQIEMKCKAFSMGARISEAPIIFGKRVRGYSKLTFRIIIEGLRAPWVFRFYSH